MNKHSLASIVSAVMNAPFITLATFVPLILSYGRGSFVLLLGITSIFGCVLPLLLAYVLMRKGVISDVYASDRTTRTEPFLWAMASYLAGVAALLLVNAPPAVTGLMACYFVNGLILLIITLKWKISIHASGITSPVTALVFQLGSWMLPFFLLTLPVAWARLELKAHDIKQVTAGAVLSSLLTWIQMSLYVHYLFI